MKELNINLTNILNDWTSEILNLVHKSESEYLAIFSSDSKILYSNSAFQKVFATNSTDNFLNPSFEQILSLNYEKYLIFEGFITLGNQFKEKNVSVKAKIFRKNDKILIFGNECNTEIIEQNSQLTQLNNEINILQRKLIKEKNIIENNLQKIKEQNHQLNKLLSDKDTFINILTHDLINPLNNLSGFSERLKKNIKKYSPDEIYEKVEIINHETLIAYNLLTDILNWSKSESGNIFLKQQYFNFNEIYSNVLELIKQQAKTKKYKNNLQRQQHYTNIRRPRHV